MVVMSPLQFAPTGRFLARVFFFHIVQLQNFFKFDFFFNDATQCKKGIDKPNVAGIIVLGWSTKQ